MTKVKITKSSVKRLQVYYFSLQLFFVVFNLNLLVMSG